MSRIRYLSLIFAAISAFGLSGCLIETAIAAENPSSTAARLSVLSILNDSDLPDTYPQARYEVHLMTEGGVPGLRWRVEKGSLPPGLILDDSGFLHGSPQREGNFQFTIAVTSSNTFRQVTQKEFRILVSSTTSHDLTILNDSDLPSTYPSAPYEIHLTAQGGVPSLHWRLERGALPAGVKIEDNGLLHGEPQRQGEFQFMVTVTDSGSPQQTAHKQFGIRVRSAMILNWISPAHVSGSRIEGSVEVSNTTPDDIDLTFDVKAVAENGRATEIGYQHFILHGGGVSQALPFGENLPHGGYVIYVNAAGEVPPKNLIYRERMQSPGPLQVNVGP